MGARNRGGRGLGYRPARYIGWRNSFLGIHSGAPYTFKIRVQKRVGSRLKSGINKYAVPSYAIADVFLETLKGLLMCYKFEKTDYSV
jgi:hypothetical protein